MKNIPAAGSNVMGRGNGCMWGLITVLAIATGAPTEASVAMDELIGEIGPGVTVSSFFGTAGESSIVVNGEADAFVSAWLESDNPKFEKFLRVEVLQQTEHSHSVVLHSLSNPDTLEAGDWVLVSFYARTGGGASDGAAIFSGFIERSEPSWMSLGELGGLTLSEWNRYIAVGEVKEDEAAGAVKLSVHLGYGVQSIDLGGFAVLSLEGEVDPSSLPYTRIAYEGMAADALWRERATEMIAENRMGDFSVQLADANGDPVVGARIKVELETHEYQFGTFFSQLALEQTDVGEKYRGWIRSNFNYTTTPVYWADWGWADPVRRGEYLEMASWLQEIGMPARGHVLIYPGWQFAPAELKALADAPEAFNAMVIDHLEEIVPLMAERGIKEYDVINELRHLKDFTDIVGMDTVVDWFWKVRELQPDAILYINENSILTDGGRNKVQQDHYFNLIQWLLDEGAPLDGIGMQGHMSEATTPPELLWPILDRFSVFGLPIRITEYDLGTRDLEGQAAYDRDFTTAIFAHPATVGMTRWGFYEPVMWRPLGGLIAADGALKPNGLATRKLLFEDWQSDVSGVSDADGAFTCRAFYGEYFVRVTVDGTTHMMRIKFDRPGGDGGSRPYLVVIP